MRLDQLIDDIYVGEIASSFRQLDISSIRCDSRKVRPGDLFVALKGAAYNGEDFIEEAISKGASVIITSQSAQRITDTRGDVYFLPVDDSRKFLHKITQKFYGQPSAQVRTIGITGTNGKTTVSYLIESILNEDRKECGVIGTVNYRRSGYIVPAAQTTPDFVDNQTFLAELVKCKIPYCVMEVSSHALSQDRVEAIEFCAAVFTNLTGDHLDYHETREKYFLAKAKLFTMLPSKSTAVINTDDIYGQQLIGMVDSKVKTFGIHRPADVMAENIKLTISGSQFQLSCPYGKIKINTKLIGNYNIYNILAAASTCMEEGISLNTIKSGIERMQNIPGRLEKVEQGQDFSIFIDYAHTQDALENVLSALREVSRAKIILVFGCGGDRDKSKRRLMGRTAGQLADLSIVTSDNPRSENPQRIIDEIKKGFHRDNFKIVVDRKLAIHEALNTAHTGDIVLIAGKGHETYQVIAAGDIDFNELEIIKAHLSC